MLLLLYLPIALLFIFSFNANTILSFPLKGFTLEWFQKLFQSPNLLHIMMASNNDWVVPAGPTARRSRSRSPWPTCRGN